MSDTKINEIVKHSLENHLTFVYPNGAIDGSWGIRSNKWTTFGSSTADGCQFLFSLFAPEDDRYRTAALRNLEYLRTIIHNGIIGYGPHYFDIFNTPPCIYPTFARAKNLALTVELGEQQPGIIPPLPVDAHGWLRLFPTVDVAQVRTQNFMATISAYRYKELKKRNNSKYIHRPTGGSICNLWVGKHGFLQISSQTEYHRWEPMHFPEAENILPLTPRIEFENENGYFTNLYEFDGRLQVQLPASGEFFVKTTGELSDHFFLPGGVAYCLEHRFTDNFVEKTVSLRYHDGNRSVCIVEPIFKYPGMTFKRRDDRTIIIQGANRRFHFEVLEGEVTLEAGKDEVKYQAVFPAVKCYPIVLKVNRPDSAFITTVRYRIAVLYN